jgi:hypothetical protein
VIIGVHLPNFTLNVHTYLSLSTGVHFENASFNDLLVSIVFTQATPCESPF